MKRLPIALLPLLACLACGQTYMLYVPEAPFAFGEPAAQAEESDPRVHCEFMTVLIDYSRDGMGLSPADLTVASRVAEAMTEEFENIGTRVTDSRAEAYWSLMILASNNERHDGYIFSALLAARNLHEGDSGGLSTYGADAAATDGEIAERIEIPTMYNGLSHGPYASLDDQAREYVQRAYKAVFPAARQLCDFEAADQDREAEIDAQLPTQPQPL